MFHVERLRPLVSRGTADAACVSRRTGPPACFTWNSRTLVSHLDARVARAIAGTALIRARGRRSYDRRVPQRGHGRASRRGPLERRAHRGGAQSTGEPRSVARVLGSSAPAPRCFTWNVRAPGVTSAPPSRNDGRRGTVAELAMRAGLTPLRGSARQRNVSRGTAPRTLSRVTLHRRNPGIHARPRTRATLCGEMWTTQAERRSFMRSGGAAAIEVPRYDWDVEHLAASGHPLGPA